MFVCRPRRRSLVASFNQILVRGFPPCGRIAVGSSDLWRATSLRRTAGEPKGPGFPAFFPYPLAPILRQNRLAKLADFVVQVVGLGNKICIRSNHQRVSIHPGLPLLVAGGPLDLVHKVPRMAGAEWFFILGSDDMY